MDLILNVLISELWLDPQISITVLCKFISKKKNPLCAYRYQEKQSHPRKAICFMSLTATCYSDAKVSIVPLCAATKSMLS